MCIRQNNPPSPLQTVRLRLLSRDLTGDLGFGRRRWTALAITPPNASVLLPHPFVLRSHPPRVRRRRPCQDLINLEIESTVNPDQFGGSWSWGSVRMKKKAIFLRYLANEKEYAFNLAFISF